jgi:hypothetical protein
MYAREKMKELINSHQTIIEEYELTFKHDYLINQDLMFDIAIFKGDRKLVAFNYIEISEEGRSELFSLFYNTGFDFWCLYDSQTFYLKYMQVFRAFEERIIPFKTFLYRISNDTV